jgi:hypothetical protein
MSDSPTTSNPPEPTPPTPPAIAPDIPDERFEIVFAEDLTPRAPKRKPAKRPRTVPRPKTKKNVTRKKKSAQHSK